MKIGVITLPLHSNYGGVIQAYVLQQVLLNLGHDVKLISKKTFLKKSFFLLQWMKYVKRFILKISGISKSPVFLEDCYNASCSKLDSFVSQRIICRMVVNLEDVLEDEFDVLIFGSDQVWRPQYALYGWGDVTNVFAGFAKNWNVKRLAYAVSFGVDEWEYSADETDSCSFLAKKFAAISVREHSAVNLCRKYLCVDSVQVLDPTMLWTKRQYCELCKDVPMTDKKILVAYILNVDKAIMEKCKKIAKEKCLSLRLFSSDSNASLNVYEWLAMFRDAAYVITDSFHGTVFSIIFEKEFECLYNESRGMARFETLLSIHKNNELEKMREFSLNWLKSSLI